MKKKLLMITFVWLSSFAYSQTTQAIKYQTVARDISGKILINQDVSFLISIYHGEPTGAVLYSETQSVLSNEFGIVNLTIGKGEAQSGGFSSLDLDKESYFLRLQIDASGGNNYVLMETTRLETNLKEFTDEMNSAFLAVDNSDSILTIPGANTKSMMVNANTIEPPNKKEKSDEKVTSQQVIGVPQGWTGLSSFIIPDNPDIENLFLPIQDQLILLFSQQGVYYPSQQLNTLVNWNPQSGYLAKFNQETSIEFSGQPVQSRVLNLAIGWNLIPVLSGCPVNVDSLFGNADVVVLKEVAGWKLYWPGVGINTLSELLPGNAYYVLMDSPAEITFPNCGTTPWQCGDLLVDTRDGKTYTTVQIGTQCWMRQNLNIGAQIAGTNELTNNGTWEKYCYNNLETNCDMYGGLYQWNEAMQYSTTQGTKGICAGGWHLPADAEWVTLTAYLGGESVAGGKMKETGTTHWSSPNTDATNSSGFTALPGGYRINDGSFEFLEIGGVFWSSTQEDASNAWYLYLDYSYANANRNYYDKALGFSVRCLKDANTFSYLELTPPNQNVTHSAGTTTFSVTSNTSWTVEESVSWLSVYPVSGSNDGSITVTYDANSGTESRTGQITITGAGGTPVKNVTLTQAGIPTLTVTPLNQNVTSAAGATTFVVNSNTTWTVSESVTWLSVSPTSGGNNGTITITYAANSSTESRNGQITITATEGTPAVIVTVTQAGSSAWVCGQPLTDTRDGKTYTTVQIGTQCWMAQNLNIGTRIDVSSLQTNNGNREKYCYYNLETNCDVYGGLYQWDEMMEYSTTPGIKGICPDGWHIPTEGEWTILTEYLGGDQIAGGKLKEKGTTHWTSPNLGASNSSGFMALPGGGNSPGSFSNIGISGVFWGSTAGTWGPDLISLEYNSVNLGSGADMQRTKSFSVRCLSDAAFSYLNVTPPNQDVSASAGITTINVSSNTLWTVSENVSWLSVSPAFGSNNSTLNVTYDTNTSSDSRIGQITISTTDGAFVVNVNVTQVVLTVTPLIQNVTLAAGSTTFNVTSSSSWAVDESDSWLSVSPANGSNNGILTIIYDANSSSEIRNGQITITTAGGTPVVNVMVNQAGYWACGQSITDTRDDKTYTTVQIGTQCWMTHNLNIGSRIDATSSQTNNGTIEKYCYNNLETNCDVYGGLYQWDEMMSFSTTPGVSGICPPGGEWHLPTKAEFTTLWTFLGVREVAGGKMKETGTSHWTSPNNGATNSSRFTGLPGGNSIPSGAFYYIGDSGDWWSSTQSSATNAGYLGNYYYNAYAFPGDYTKVTAYSVRCLRDETFSSFLYVTQPNQKVTASAGTTTFDISSNVTWTVAESVSWLSVSPANGSNNGTLTVIYDANSSSDSRNGQITITAAGGSLVAYVMVAQDGFVPVFTVNPLNQNVTSDVGTTTFDVSSNTSWTVAESVSWLSVSPASGSNNGTLTVSYDAILGSESRVGQISIASTDGTSVVNATVTQAILTVTPLNQNISLVAGTTNLEVSSHTSWAVVESVPWLSVSPASGSNNGTLTITYSTNSDPDSRIGQITITASGGTPQVNVTVTQPGFWACGQPITDTRDSKSYTTVQIGTQCWMKQNLNIGTRINFPSGQTNNGIIEKYCYNNLETNCDVYGGLYQWDEMMAYSSASGVQGICPPTGGWHLPTDAEWTTLTTYVSSQQAYLCNSTSTYIAKSLAATTNWNTSNSDCAIGNNLAANNATGFTCLPGGNTFLDGTFLNLGYSSEFWSSTQSNLYDAELIGLSNYMPQTVQGSNTKSWGYSARCIKSSFLYVTPPNQNVSASSGTTTYDISSNLSWTVAESTSWLSVSPVFGNSNGTLTVTYEANSSPEIRIGQITITAAGGDPVEIVTLTQAGATPVLHVTPINQNVTFAAGTTAFDVTSNTSWAISENVSWLFVSPTNGYNGTLTVTYEANSSPVIRVGQIIITAAGGAPTVIGTVTQAALPVLTASPLNKNVSLAAGTTTFDVSSNISWTVAESVSWLSVSPASGSNNGTLSVSYDANSGSDSRIGQITIAADGGTLGINVTVTQAAGPWVCDSSFAVNHVAGAVAPVTKTVTYGTISNIPGETSKCWITRNLGASQQATDVSDATEASAGWFWQFNRKQGYKHDGTTRTPNTLWISSISETSDWTTANDPCALELGDGWHIPTNTEWSNVDASGNWTTWNGPWNSGLKMHAAGYLFYSNGLLNNRGWNGGYWGMLQSSATNGLGLGFGSGNSVMTNSSKAYGYSLRCLKDGTYSAFLNVTPANQDVTASAGTTYFTVSSNTSWTVAENVSWLSVSPSSGSANSTLTVTYDANSGSENRIGQIALSAAGGTQSVTISVTQYDTIYDCDLIIDTRDIKTYTTMQIGTQCWMAQNLNIGTRINGITEQTNNGTIEKYCYNNLETNCDVYGGLYQWNEMMEYSTIPGVQGICPTNWHLPTDSEWTTLTTFLGGVSVAGGKMKEAGTTHWLSPNTGATNSSGFTGLPGVSRYTNGSFGPLGYNGYFWSSSEFSSTNSWPRYLVYNTDYVHRLEHTKGNGFSVRCLKDETTSNSLNVTPPNQDVTTSAGTTTFDVTSNLSWTVAENVSWLSVSPASGSTSGTLSVTYDANTSSESRIGQITITADGGTSIVNVTVTQAGFVPVLTVTPLNQNVTLAAGTTTFNVSSNTSWTVAESVSWLSVSPASGSNNGTLMVTYDANSGSDSRTGQITITATGGTPIVNITVTQAGFVPVLTVTPLNQNVTIAASTTTFEVTSNTSWTVAESVSWLSVSPASGSNNGTLTVSYDANSGSDSRTGQITITADGGTPVVNVTVTQYGSWVCGSPFTINHLAGAVAPVTKTVTYGTVTNIPGSTTKCWITSNLGADHQAAAVSDATEASAGWYWQFNRKQGYKHDGTTRTPNTTWISSISETSDWSTANDPCALELGSGWRIPTNTEWTNVDASGSWSNWNGPWNSGLKMHAAGCLLNSVGSLINRDSIGSYWSSTQYSAPNGWFLYFNSGGSNRSYDSKAYGFPLRCLKD